MNNCFPPPFFESRFFPPPPAGGESSKHKAQSFRKAPSDKHQSEKPPRPNSPAPNSPAPPQNRRATRALIRYSSPVNEATPTIRNLALVGFMGTGKSTVGHHVADDLRFTFLDTDDLLEKRADKSIARIFAEDGEPVFRQLESDLVRDLETKTNCVIATGGGLIVNPANLASLKKHALVICLWASPEAIWQRTRHQSHRPLLNGPDPLQTIRTLLAAREPYYRQADVLVNTEYRGLREVTHQIIHHFHQSQGHPHTRH